MEFQLKEVPNAYILQVHGEIDLATAPQLSQELERLVDGGSRAVILDLSHLEYLDLSGIKVFEAVHERLHRHNQQLVLCASSYPVHRILGLAQVDKVISMFSTVDAALDSLRGSDSLLPHVRS